MDNEPRITPSKLGAFCGANACLRCGYYLLRNRFKKPFDFGTPYIMQLLDQRQKQIARVALDTEGKLPEFFGAFRSATKLIDCKSMSAFHEETGLQLYGMPDLVFENKDGSRMIVDDKTAFPKSEDDSLFHKYRTQISFYGFLCEQAEDPHRVSSVGILYYVYQPTADADILKSVGSENIGVEFKAVLAEMEYNPEEFVLPHLRTVRTLLDLTEPPEGLEGCKDCKLLEAFVALIPVPADAAYLKKILNDKEFMQHMARKAFLDHALAAVDFAAETAKLVREASPNGILANWNFDEE